MLPFFLEKELCFPANYPVGCLLGCVDVIDCLSQEEYREQVYIPTLNTFMYPHSQTPRFLFFCLHGSGRTAKAWNTYHMNDIRWIEVDMGGRGPHSNNLLDVIIECSIAMHNLRQLPLLFFSYFHSFSCSESLGTPTHN